MTKELFRKLFVFRDDVYALQTPDGSYRPIEEKVTDQVIQAHLSGSHTIGLYQLKKDKIKWAVLDIDLIKSVWSDPNFDLNEWEKVLKKQAEKAKAILDAHGIPSYIEHSGHKGYHVWIFFEHPTPSSVIKQGMERMFGVMQQEDPAIEWEIFPKQILVHPDSYGSLVKGASGYHHKSQRNSKFIDPISLQSVKYAKPYRFQDTSKLDVIRARCGALKTAWDEAVETGKASNNLRVAIVTQFVNVDEPKAFVQQYLIDEFFSHMNNFDERRTKYHMDKMWTEPNPDGTIGYAPTSCATLQSQKICPAKCDEIGNAKTPFVFYLREKHKNKPNSPNSNYGNYGDSPEPEEVESALSKYKKIGNGYYVEKEKGGLTQLSNFLMNIEKTYKSDDGIEKRTLYKGTLISEDGEEIPFELDSEDYSDNMSFKKFIYRNINITKLVLTSNLEELKSAIQAHAEADIIKVIKQFGFRYDEDSKFPKDYITPSSIIDKNGIRDNDENIVDLSSEKHAGCLDLFDIEDDLFKEVVEQIKQDFLNLIEHGAALSVLAHVFTPIVFPYIAALGDHTRFTFFVRGSTGSSKSFIVKLMQNFYGYFDNEDIVSWSSTANGISRIGYFFNDAILDIDDFKKQFLKGWERAGKMALLQNFADNTTRSRMRQDLKMAKSYPIRGWISIGAEDIPEGEASNIARLIAVEAEIESPRYAEGNRCMEYRQYYPAVTARGIHYLLNINPLLIQKAYKDYTQTFLDQVGNTNNAMRLSRNTAILCTAFHFISDFLWPKKEAQQKRNEFVEYHSKRLDKAVYETTDELSTERLVRTLNELISTGKAAIQPSYSANTLVDTRAEVIGYYGNIQGEDPDEKFPHIIVSRALELVQKNLRDSDTRIDHSRRAIILDLYKQGFTLEPREVNRKMNDTSVRVIRFYPEKFSPSETINEEED